MLIEAGGDNKRDDLYVPSERFVSPYLNREINKQYQTVPQKHVDGRILEYIRGKGLGGSSIANFLAYIRGSASDYNVWADMVGDDTFKWDNVLERYKKLENLHFDEDNDKDGYVKLREGAHGFNGPVDITLPSRQNWSSSMNILAKNMQDFGWTINPDQNSGDIVGFGAVTTTVHEGRRVTSSTAYLTDPPPNLEIWTNSEVTKLLLESESSTSTPKAVGVILADGREVKASKEVILSLGSIDTPRLLMLSGIGPKSELERLGISSVVDLPRVGKDMVDHNYIMMFWGAKGGLGGNVADETDPEKNKAIRAQWKESHTGLDATRHTQSLIGFLKLSPDRCSFDELEKLEPVYKNWIKQPNVPQYEAFFQPIAGKDWDYSLGEECIGCAVMLMNPQSRGTVTLPSKDPKAEPLIDVNFFSHPYDPRTMVDGIREVLTFVRETEVSKYIVKGQLVPQSDSDEDILKFVKDNLMSVLHPVATVKMGRKDDPNACADTDFRVRGVQNLRVIDLSVCPLITRLVDSHFCGT